MRSKKPIGDKALRAWESSRDLSAELEQSINEMLAGQGKPVAVSRVVAIRIQSGLSPGSAGVGGLSPICSVRVRAASSTTG